MKPRLIVVCGPTAVGKTAVSIDLAKDFGTEIISADSRQFYEELKIGTAPPSAEELPEVHHHFIGNKTLDEDFSAGEFAEVALKKIAELHQQNPLVFMVGGSGLYIKAVCEGLDEFPETAPEIRGQLNKEFAEKGIEALQQKLKKLDPEHYKKVDLQNPHRLIRALEVCIATGKPYSTFQSGEKQERDFNILKIGLELSREELYHRINKRVDAMMKAGLLEEAKSVQTFKNKNALQTVGYKELFDYLEGKTSLEEAVEDRKSVV